MKKFLKNKDICKVTFKLPSTAAPNAKKAHLVGEFNNWDLKATPLKKLKNGDFSVTLDLETNREYRYRYLIDSERWENDWEADRYERTPFGDSDNSVLVLYQTETVKN